MKKKVYKGAGILQIINKVPKMYYKSWDEYTDEEKKQMIKELTKVFYGEGL